MRSVSNVTQSLRLCELGLVARATCSAVTCSDAQSRSLKPPHSGIDPPASQTRPGTDVASWSLLEGSTATTQGVTAAHSLMRVSFMPDPDHNVAVCAIKGTAECMALACDWRRCLVHHYTAWQRHARYEVCPSALRTLQCNAQQVTLLWTATNCAASPPPSVICTGKATLMDEPVQACAIAPLHPLVDVFAVEGELCW